MIGAAGFIICFFLLWGIALLAGPHVVRLVRVIARFATRSAPMTRFRSRVSKFEWLASHWPVFVIVAAGGWLAVWAGDGFFDIAETIRSQSIAGQRADHVTYDWLRSHRDQADDIFFVGATMFGSPVSMGIIVVAVASVLVYRHRYRWTGYLAGTATGGALVNEILKRHFARARPDLNVAVLRARGYSFPSGHAMGSTIVFTALAYLGMRALTEWPQKSAVIAFCAAIILTISFSRIYLGVHWISDVAAGIAAGLVWTTATTTAYETIRRLRIVRARILRTRTAQAEAR